MASSTLNAIVLDDDEEIASLIAELATRAGYDVSVSTNPTEFRAALVAGEPRLIVIDLQMPGLDGMEVLRQLADEKCSAAILIVTGMDQRTMLAAEEYGRSRNLNVDSLQKPFSPPDLLDKMIWARGVREQLTVSRLDEAIKKNELMVYYQPTIRRFADGSWDIEAAEALLRWNHPQRGILTPDSFLAMGEDGGLARSMADYVLQRGIEQLRAWRSQNHRLGLRVNISAQLIADLSFPDRLATLLNEYQLDASLLTLEITETAMLEHRPDTLDILTRLRVKDIQLAIDDFGIGHSSLTQLFRMPFSEMKIDKTLVINTADSREAKIMVETLVDLAHRLGLTACAEGVETTEALEFLDQIGCDSAQGYLISRPVQASDLAKILARWPRAVSEVALAS